MKLWRKHTYPFLNVTEWVLVRVCHPDTASQWLDVYQKTEPTETFTLSDKKPKGSGKLPKAMRGPGVDH